MLLPASRSNASLLLSASNRDGPPFASSKVLNMSYHSAFELDDDRKASLKSKRGFNPAKSVLDQTCENDLGTLTLAEARDVVKTYTRLLFDFEKLNRIESVTREVCVKQVYLLLLNIKNPDFDRTLNPHKFTQLFRVLEIDLTEE